MASSADERLTGERPIEGHTPDSLLALHDAGYREVIARVGDGVVLDIGCGVGAETIRLGGPDRFVVGVDYHPATAIAAQREWGPQGLRFAGMDGGRLAVRDHSVDHVCSSHIIEHFTAPETHVAEIARTLRPGGAAYFLTPNRTADFENPFHVYLFNASELESMLRLFFHEVEIVGLDASEAVKSDFAARRRSGERLLKLDAFDIRHKLPRSWYIWAYTRALPVVYRLVAGDQSGGHSGITADDFFVSDQVDDTTPVLLATARSPRID
ncbi:MAG TPA: class I SAM-dependent methyltransferase [Acidimicrobiia bacterium]|nr:class I SAM-dependent methyltransferase [Acidimicrobiia bacterium]